MSVKKIIAGIFLLLSVPANLFAVNSTNKEDQWSGTHRSRPTTLSVSIEENTICILSEKQLDNIDIQVKDLAGNTISTDVTTILPGITYTLSLDALPQGDYQLLLRQGDKYLVEVFTKQ